MCFFLINIGIVVTNQERKMERHLDPDAYLDEMDRLDRLEEEAQYKLEQQEKHDD
jgi:hypothetical protein